MVIPTKCSKAVTDNSVKNQLKSKHPKSTNTSTDSSSEDGSANDEFTARFEVMDEIGSGSFRSVYRGLDRTTGQEVAIKMEKKTRGKLSSIATEIKYYETLLESQDMNENQELQFHSDPVSSNGHSNVTMDQQECEWFPVEGAEENDEIQSRSEDTDENDTSSKEGEDHGNGMEGRKVEQGERIEEGNTVEKGQENGLLEVLAPTSLGIPKLIFSGIVGKKYVIVMEMLGPNLEKLFNTCNRRFSLKTVTQLALQIVLSSFTPKDYFIEILSRKML